MQMHYCCNYPAQKAGGVNYVALPLQATYTPLASHLLLQWTTWCAQREHLPKGGPWCPVCRQTSLWSRGLQFAVPWPPCSGPHSWRGTAPGGGTKGQYCHIYVSEHMSTLPPQHPSTQYTRGSNVAYTAHTVTAYNCTAITNGRVPHRGYWCKTVHQCQMRWKATSCRQASSAGSPQPMTGQPNWHD